MLTYADVWQPAALPLSDHRSLLLVQPARKGKGEEEDVAKAERESARGSCRISKAKTGAQFACFTRTKVQILTAEELLLLQRAVQRAQGQRGDDFALDQGIKALLRLN